MNGGLREILESKELTEGEKLYIKDCHYNLGGSFSNALWRVISAADPHNLAKLKLVFPDEVQGYLAWTQGDLYERAIRICGGVMKAKDEN